MKVAAQRLAGSRPSFFRAIMDSPSPAMSRSALAARIRLLGLAVLLLFPPGAVLCQDRGPDFGWYAPPPLRLPQLVPGRGLAWSKARYPEQHEPSNLAAGRLHGLDDRENERFLDVANRAYSREFVTGFSYTEPALARPEVTVTFCRRAETFAGRLVARGLKPHFAYQLKLRGDHEADPVAFARIGRLGRWRRRGSLLTNFTDQDFAAAADKSLFESYVLFDFFVTDHQGAAEKDFYLDSTLHVLFNYPWQAVPGDSDSRPVTVRFTNTAARIYANPRPAVAPQGVFAQTEAGFNGQVRPGIGEAFLPPGAYRARLALVEESFHSYGDGGYWATVMECDVAFEVVSRPRPPPPAWRHDLAGGRPVPFTDFVACHAAVESLAADFCRFVPDGGGLSPRLLLTNAVPLRRGERQIAAFEVRSEMGDTLTLLAGDDPLLRTADSYRLPAAGFGGWQRVEVEITFAPEIERCHLAFALPRLAAGVELRNLRLIGLPPAP